MEPEEMTPTMDGKNLASEQMDYQWRRDKHYDRLGITQMEHSIAKERAELALKVYAKQDSMGTGLEADIITKKELRAVLLVALGLDDDKPDESSSGYTVTITRGGPLLSGEIRLG